MTFCNNCLISGKIFLNNLSMPIAFVQATLLVTHTGGIRWEWIQTRLALDYSELSKGYQILVK